MPYEYLDHVADIGLKGTGATLAEALESAVQGMLDLMVNTSTVTPHSEMTVDAEGVDPGALYVALLNAILAERDIKGWFFHSFRLDSLEERTGGWHATGTLTGEPVDLARHDAHAEIKAATYSGLRVTIEEEHAEVVCVLDM